MLRSIRQLKAKPEPASSEMPASLVGESLGERVEAYEKALIAAEMAKGHGSLRSLAEALGLPRKTLHDRLRKHGLEFGGED